MPLNCLNEKIYLLLISMDKIAIELSKLPFIETINALKAEIDGSKPISKEIEDKVFQKLKLDWNYNSNAIEGNKLNYGETVAFLMHGITAKGKTLKDHLDIKGHNEAINFLLSLVKEDRDISESDIRGLHKMILVEEYDSNAKTLDGQQTNKRVKLGVYKTTPNSVETRTGEMHYYASPEETPALMADLMNWYNENKTNNEIHPLVLASLFHFKFVAIHPFDDGNGRLARILMNLILLRNNLPVVVVKNEDKQNYYGVLAQADSNQFIPLTEYMSDLLQHSLNLYLKGIKGESIEEESDIDKEIALLKKSMNSNVFDRKEKNKNEVQKRLNDSIIPLIISVNNKVNQVKDFFYKRLYILNEEDSDYGFGSEYYSLESLENKLFSLVFENKKTYFKFRIALLELKTDEKVSIDIDIWIYFEKYQYELRCNNVISKYYNEKISQEEVNTFVNAIMKDILKQIKQATNQ